jgi:hypothetical protein
MKKNIFFVLGKVTSWRKIKGKRIMSTNLSSMDRNVEIVSVERRLKL